MPTVRSSVTPTCSTCEGTDPYAALLPQARRPDADRLGAAQDKRPTSHGRRGSSSRLRSSRPGRSSSRATPPSTRSSCGRGSSPATTPPTRLTSSPTRRRSMCRRRSTRGCSSRICATAAGRDEPELTLFDSFDGLEDLDLIEFYKHQANWSNRMILGDSLQVMGSPRRARGPARPGPDGLPRPPYGIKFGSNWRGLHPKRDVGTARSRKTPAARPEQIKAFRDTWERHSFVPLTYLRDRLLVARRFSHRVRGVASSQIGDENVHLVRKPR